MRLRSYIRVRGGTLGQQRFHAQSQEKKKSHGKGPSDGLVLLPRKITLKGSTSSWQSVVLPQKITSTSKDSLILIICTVSFLFFFFLFYATLIVPLDELQKTKPDKQDHSSNYSCIWACNVTLDDIILWVGLPLYKKAQGDNGRIVDY